MTSLVRISHLPSHESEETQVNSLPNIKVTDGRLETLLSLTDQMDELKKRSASLEDLWAVYEKLDSDELKSRLKAKINQKTEFANSLATKIQETLEMEEKNKKLNEAKQEEKNVNERRFKFPRSPLSSPTPRTSRAFF